VRIGKMAVGAVAPIAGAIYWLLEISEGGNEGDTSSG